MGKFAPKPKQCRRQPRRPRAQTKKRGGREALTVDQVIHFYFVLLRDVNSAWAAVMFILGILLGERAELLCHVQDDWFGCMDPSQGILPQCFVRPINKKTKGREVPLDRDFGKLLWTWATGSPLMGGYDGVGHRSQWPHPGQVLFQRRLRRFGKQPSGKYLFPGRALGGDNSRAWTKAVTSRGFFSKFQAAQQVIIDEIKKSRSKREPHPFDDVSIKRVTSHSMKKSAVTLMKTAGCSTAIVSAITGTSTRVLDSVYDIATQRRQRQAAAVFQPILQGIHVPERKANTASDHDQACRFCVQCGHQLENSWLFCRFCGQKQPEG